MSGPSAADTAYPASVPVFGAAPEGLLERFWVYERVLMANDLEALDELFAADASPEAPTLRGDLGGLLIGHDRISAFRAVRGGAPARLIDSVHVRAIGADDALVIAVTRARAGGVGQQTQLWHRDRVEAEHLSDEVEHSAGEWNVPPRPGAGAWRIVAAHVSATSAAAVDPSIWRLVGTPLVAGEEEGPLAGVTVAVKDLIEVAGFPVGAGVPAYLDEAEPAPVDAPALDALLQAGASVAGIARTDEFAYSIAGRNPHYGTPPNPAVTGGLPGGSSSGPASAVALGQAALGLATDTAGSIRVPASYQGIWGLRTTHGAVPVSGVLPLAPSYDTVGYLARSAELLARAARVGLAHTPQHVGGMRLAVVDLGSAALSDELAAAFDRTVDELAAVAEELGAELDDETFDPSELAGLGDPGGLGALYELFRVTQAAEAWREHGAWIDAQPGALGTEVGARFVAASRITQAEERDALAGLAAARVRLEAATAGRVLVLPSASSAAPDARAEGPAVEAARAATLRLTCLAGVLGRPAISAPLMRVAAGPVGLSLVGERFTDVAIVELGGRIAARLGTYPASAAVGAHVGASVTKPR